MWTRTHTCTTPYYNLSFCLEYRYMPLFPGTWTYSQGEIFPPWEKYKYRIVCVSVRGVSLSSGRRVETPTSTVLESVTVKRLGNTEDRSVTYLDLCVTNSEKDGYPRFTTTDSTRTSSEGRRPRVTPLPSVANYGPLSDDETTEVIFVRQRNRFLSFSPSHPFSSSVRVPTFTLSVFVRLETFGGHTTVRRFVRPTSLTPVSKRWRDPGTTPQNIYTGVWVGSRLVLPRRDRTVLVLYTVCDYDRSDVVLAITITNS